MKYRLSGLFVGLSLLLASVPAWAHHSTQAEFDLNKKIEMTGTVARMEWVNPHAYLFLDIKDGDKTKRWAFEFAGPQGLSRVGLRKSDGGLKPGDTVTVMGFPAKDGANLGFVQEITLANGHKITVWNQDPNAN